jgi:hypothetical protein
MTIQGRMKLDDNGFIQAFGEEEESECEHLGCIALRHAQNIQALFWDQQNEKARTQERTHDLQTLTDDLCGLNKTNRRILSGRNNNLSAS